MLNFTVNYVPMNMMIRGDGDIRKNTKGRDGVYMAVTILVGFLGGRGG
jgi:hypothetical protein